MSLRNESSSWEAEIGVELKNYHQVFIQTKSGSAAKALSKQPPTPCPPEPKTPFRPSFSPSLQKLLNNPWQLTGLIKRGRDKCRGENPKRGQEVLIGTSMPTRRAKVLCQSPATTCRTSHRSTGVVRLAGSTHTSRLARGQENLSSITRCIIWLVHWRHDAH